MNKKLTKAWLLAALIRAIRTVAQTALGLLTVGLALSETHWTYVLSVAAAAGVYSLLTSIATGLPESVTNGTLQIDCSNEDKDIIRLDLDDDVPLLTTMKTITLTVNNKANLAEITEPLIE